MWYMSPRTISHTLGEGTWRMRLFRRFRRHRTIDASAPLRAEGLASLLSEAVFDRHKAAEFLGVSVTSVEMAAWRQTLPSVMYNRLRLFTRRDLEEYAQRRGTGRASKLRPMPMWIIVGRQAIRLDPPFGKRYGPKT